MEISALARNGLILFDTIRDRVDDSSALRREVDRGTLVPLRRGAFVEASHWNEATSRQRHLLRARAVIAASSRPLVLAGVSAAAVFGMPIAGDWPDEVTVLDQWRGGGRSDPGIRRTAAGYRTALVETVEGFRVTSLARTALDVARSASFADAIGSVDWALWRRNPLAISKNELAEELRRMNPRFGLAHLRRVVAFATTLSDSFGESHARAMIHLLGFDPPELQVRFVDAEGEMFPDYYWRVVKRGGEFDGKAKYTRGIFTGGDPSEVVWKEKKREDRLRRLECPLTRIVFADTHAPQRLETLLLEAGIPRGGDNLLRR